MRTIIFLLQKEFRQIRRNKVILPVIFVLPIVQLLILVHATTFEIKQVKLCIVDQDLSNTSRRLVNKLEGTSFFKITGSTFNMKEARNHLSSDKADMILYIPQDFSKNLVKEKQAYVQLIPNAINANFASLSYNYASKVVMDFNKEVMVEWVGNIPPQKVKTVSINSQFWYNPELDYKWYMFPGILVILVSMVGLMLSGLNLVREKEIGTIEQLNVTPIKKYQFIIGKLLPFLIIGLFVLGLGIFVGKIAYQIPTVGSLWVLFGFATVYLLAILGIGLFISTIADTQQQMMFIAFFIVIVFILLSGIFTPEESMPKWVQQFNLINPLAYFMRVIRMNMLKGAGFSSLVNEFIGLGIYAVAILSLATWQYRKTN